MGKLTRSFGFISDTNISVYFNLRKHELFIGQYNQSDYDYENKLKFITTNEIGLVGVVFRFIWGEACCGNTQTPPLNAGWYALDVVGTCYYEIQSEMFKLLQMIQ